MRKLGPVLNGLLRLQQIVEPPQDASEKAILDILMIARAAIATGSEEYLANHLESIAPNIAARTQEVLNIIQQINQIEK